MRVTEKGKVTSPKPLRDELGIGAGSGVTFEVTGDAIVVRKVTTGVAAGDASSNASAAEGMSP